ncbi:unnamed protein product [Cunninghamella blakesleeana]
MIPSTTYSAPLSSKKEGFPLRPLSANLSSPTSLAQRRNRNNKNLSLCLTPSTTTSTSNHSNTNLDINHLIPPSTPFTPFKTNQSTKHYEHGPICILPGIYLGDESNAVNEAQLKLYNIHYIMNVATEVNHPRIDSFDKWDEDHQHHQHHHNNEIVLPCPTLSSSSSSTNSSSSSSSLSLTSSPTRMTKKTIKYKKRAWHHQIMDNDQLSLKELNDAVMDIVYVKESQNNKNILIHCQCGLARSASVIIAYMMYTRQLSMQLAIMEVKKQAPHINPNFSLMYHLREYERWLMVKQASTWSKKSIQHKSSNDTIKSSHSSFVAKWKNFKYKSIYRHQWWRTNASSSSNTPSSTTPTFSPNSHHSMNNIVTTTN